MIVFILLLFFIIGLIILFIGLNLLKKLKDPYSIEIDAECIDINEKDIKIGNDFDASYYHNAKTPIYRYYYNDIEYVSSPKLASNRKNYKPKLGHCIIRIDPNKPNIVYSNERKFVANILFGIGISWMLVTLLGLIIYIFIK